MVDFEHVHLQGLTHHLLSSRVLEPHDSAEVGLTRAAELVPRLCAITHCQLAETEYYTNQEYGHCHLLLPIIVYPGACTRVGIPRMVIPYSPVTEVYTGCPLCRGIDSND